MWRTSSNLTTTVPGTRWAAPESRATVLGGEQRGSPIRKETLMSQAVRLSRVGRSAIVAVLLLACLSFGATVSAQTPPQDPVLHTSLSIPHG